MKSVSYTDFRRRLKSYFNKVRSNGPILVNYADGLDVVMLSKSDYNSMQETFYLLNATRLLKGIGDYERSSVKNTSNKKS